MDKYGILSKTKLTTSWQTLYSCPEPQETTYDSSNISVTPKSVNKPTSTLVSSVVVCRLVATGGTADWFSLAVVNAAGDAVALADYICYQQDVAGGTTKIISMGMTLKGGQTLKGIGEANDSVTIIVNGVEIF